MSPMLKHFHHKPPNFLDKTQVVGEFVELKMVYNHCAPMQPTSKNPLPSSSSAFSLDN